VNPCTQPRHNSHVQVIRVVVLHHDGFGHVGRPLRRAVVFVDVARGSQVVADVRAGRVDAAAAGAHLSTDIFRHFS
jgi:hypothetical protein